MNERIERMKAQLKQGVTVHVAPLLYPTPSPLAERMVELLDIEAHDRILEPSAGTGQLLAPIRTSQLVTPPTAIEIDSNLCSALRANFGTSVDVRCCDFLEFKTETKFNKIVMNPPFNGGADIAHILHAVSMLEPCGRLVAICANGPRQIKTLKPLTGYWEPLPSGTFKHAGTNVNTVLLII